MASGVPDLGVFEAMESVSGCFDMDVGVLEPTEIEPGCFDTGPRLAIIAAASADIGEASGFFVSSAFGVVGPDFSLGKRGLLSAGERFEGTVLLRWTPDVVGVANAGVIGLGTAPECRDRLEEVDTFLRTPLYFARLSAPALEVVDADRTMPELLRPGVVGVRACGVDGPLSMCLTVPSSTAVPSIPIKKWSWLSMRKMSTSWLNL